MSAPGDHAVDGRFDRTFNALRALLTPYQAELVLVHDSATHYYLDTAHQMPNKKPLFFAAVKIGKHYVSFYLMPVYVFPDMLDGMSSTLADCMQGKSCFNFKQISAEQLAALRLLVEQGRARYQAAGYWR